MKNLTVMLHAHMPYVLHSEVEYWLHEVALHSYLPLIQMLSNQQGDTPLITLNLSPILLVQLSNKTFKDNFVEYLQVRKEILSIDLHNEQKNTILKKDLENILELEQLFLYLEKDIIKGFQLLQKENKINIITSAATHAFFPPFIQFPNLLYTQIFLGKKISEHFFTHIEGFWIPECAITPEIGCFLSKNNITYTFADPSSIKHNHNSYTSSYKDQFGILYLCREYSCTAKIWDATTGYPSNSLYREFHKDLKDESEMIQKILKKNKLPLSGVSIYSITDKTNNNKNFYSHHLANKQAYKDANNYVDFLNQQFTNKDHITVCFDAELFGHWWKDGIIFLNHLLPLVQRYSISLELPKNNNAEIHTPYFSTWGKNYTAESWVNEKNQKIWEYLITSASDIELKLQNSTISSLELYYFLLQQASDWPFLLTYDSFPELSKQMIFETNHYNNHNNLLHTLIKKNKKKLYFEI